MMVWLLVISYWIHLLATIVWLGGIVVMLFIAWPALQQESLANNQWFQLQRRSLPWINASLVILLITGFYQMTSDPNYTGFLNIDSTWAWAILLKHIAYGLMVIITVAVQVYLYPAMARLALLANKRPDLAAAEREKLQRQEILLLRINLVCAIFVLLFTAIATAV
jgi:uncharacterized membrane protein